MLSHHRDVNIGVGGGGGRSVYAAAISATCHMGLGPFYSLDYNFQKIQILSNKLKEDCDLHSSELSCVLTLEHIPKIMLTGPEKSVNQPRSLIIEIGNNEDRSKR